MNFRKSSLDGCKLKMETEKYELKYGLKKGSFSAALVEKAIAAIYSAVSRQNEIPSLH